ncbi:MAG: LemA family protein [Opitutales bacterium]
MEGIVIIAVIILVVVGCIWIGYFNSFKRLKIKVQEGLSGIEVALTKRYDLLTKMLESSKAYLKHEKELFSDVVRLRKGMSVNELNDAEARIERISSRLNVQLENYPDLKSSSVFMELQKAITDAEEHLQAARRLYNSNVTAYNTSIAMFPASIIAGMHGFAPEIFFEAQEHKREDVKMSF